jgi:hypothetical protein
MLSRRCLRAVSVATNRGLAFGHTSARVHLTTDRRRSRMPAQAFQQALGRLINDQTYRTEIEKNPNKLVDDFGIDQDEIGRRGSIRSRACSCTSGSRSCTAAA